jgi:hypothetical protein
MGVDDSDCNCEMPLDMDDAELEAYCSESTNLSFTPCGFYLLLQIMLHLGENRSADEPTPNASNAQENQPEKIEREAENNRVSRRRII